MAVDDEDPPRSTPTELVRWEAAPSPVAIAPGHDGPRWLKDARFRSGAMQVGGFAGLVLFWNVAPLAAFGSLLFGVGGGAVMRLGRSDASGRLDAILREGLVRPERTHRMLRHFSRIDGSARMRFAARAWAALYAIERGDLESAVASYTADDGWTRAWREGGLDADAAVVPAILAWIVPTAFPPNSVPQRAMIRDTRLVAAPLRSELVPSLLLMLEALEATAQGKRGFVIRALQRLDASATRQQFPLLSLLVRAQIGRNIPELRDEIESELDDVRRAFLARVMPTYARPESAGGFRSEAMLPAVQSSPPPRAPVPVRERVEVAARTRGRDRIARHHRVDASLRSAMWLGGGGFLAAAMLGSGVGALSSLGGVVALNAARSVNSRVGRARTRVASLLGLEDLALPAWRRELDREFPTLIRKERYDGSAGAAQAAGAFVQETFVSCALAEQAFRHGDLAELEANIGWWFEGMNGEAIDDVVIRCCGASLIRMAALSGRYGAAREIAALALERSKRGWSRHYQRSVYGGSVSAIHLAAALLEAREGDWSAAATHLREVRLWRGLRAWPRDWILYGRLALRARAAGADAPRVPVHRSREDDERWLGEVWPELVGSGDEVGSLAALAR